MDLLQLKQKIESRRVILENGCWILDGDRCGYPAIMIGGITYQLSRIVKLIYEGIEIKEQALHKCDERRCWNPEHIFDGTQSENIQDSISKGRSIIPSLKGNRFKTHCPNGHEHNKQNTYYYKRNNGKVNKVCKICSKDRKKRRKEFQRNVIMASRINEPTQ